MNALPHLIAARLERLVGQPLWGYGRVLDLVSLQLGERVLRPRRDGSEVVVGRHALHLQCAWRMLAGDDILVGSKDRLVPRDPEAEPGDFDPGQPGATLCDARLDALFAASESAPLVVAAAAAGLCGAFRLDLSRRHALEVFPDDSLGEAWRHLDGGDHFVFPPESTAGRSGSTP